MKVRCPHCRDEQDVAATLLNRVVDCPPCRRRYVAKPIPTDEPAAKRSSGAGVFLLVVLLIAAGALGFLSWKQSQSPLEVVRSWFQNTPTDTAEATPEQPEDETMVSLAPAPTVEQVPTVDPAPVEAEIPHEPEVVPERPPSPPKIDLLKWLLSDRARWPQTVKLRSATRFNIRADAKVIGSIEVGPESVVQLTKVDPDYAIVVFKDDPQVVPIEQTDLLERAQAEINRREALIQLSAERAATKAASQIVKTERAAPPSTDPLGRIQLTSNSLPPYRTGAFVHPGALHTQEDLKRMASKISSGQQPWKETWELLQSSPHNLQWRPRAFEQIIRGIPGSNYTPTQKDATTIYQCALRYRLDGDTAQADKAVSIMNLWARTMKKGVGGNSNFALGAGIIGYEFACAAELLRDYPGWKGADFEAYKGFLRLFLGGNRDFLIRHNGTGGTHYRLNWETCNLLSMISIAVVLDEPATFDEAVTYFLRGVGNGCIDRSIWYVHPDGSGQTEEMGRDQAHNVSGLEWMALFCEVAWNQGVDLYGYDNNRLLRGFEYVARYNLGHDDIPYAPHTTYKMNYVEGALSPAVRGIGPRYEMVYNHYVNRRGLAAPFVEEAALKTRPVGGPGGHPSAWDFFGYTTLTYTLPPIEKGASPSGLRALRQARQIDLSWWGTAHAKTYRVKRASGETDAYAVIATLDAADQKTNFTDTRIEEGATYRYQIVAIDTSGRELAGEPLTVRKQLIARFTLDNTLAESEGRRVAAHSGKPTYSPGPIPGTQALVFDGAADFVQLPRAVADTRDITIATWVYWNGGAPYQRIFDFGGDITKCFWLSPSAGDGKLRFSITTTRDMDGSAKLEGPELKTNQWVHVAVTLSGDTGTLYVNGESVATGPVTLDPLFTQNHCYLGKSQYPDPLFKGKLADFRIYNYALSVKEILSLCASRR